MKEKAAIIFPHHLFRDHPSFKYQGVSFAILVEEDRFFTEFQFHKKKLLLHRASMKHYQDLLKRRGIGVEYLENRKGKTLNYLFAALDDRGVKLVRSTEIVDHRLERSLIRGLVDRRIGIEIDESPGFLTPTKVAEDLFGGKDHLSMASFYRQQRRRLKLLIKDGKPIGGKWSFDPLNRKRIPKEVAIPPFPTLEENGYVKEAKMHVEELYPENPGSSEGFIYPTTHDEADLWLQHFLDHRLSQFGDYEDAMRADEPFLFHSILSSSLNIGLLTPEEVLKRTLDHAAKVEVPINSLEGFIRQIVGWREFMRATYHFLGDKERSMNFWAHEEKMPSSFYSASTGVLPVDNVIGRVLNQAYAHHIERLMVLGNFMNLCEIDPDQVYRWFMELFIDAYDWAMVPNVYGMSQFADGGFITTKPYISGSGYIRRMGDYPPGEWREVMDGLFWRFVDVHREVFKNNARTAVLVYQLDRMDDGKLERHRKVAEDFLRSLRGKSKEGWDLVGDGTDLEHHQEDGNH